MISTNKTPLENFDAFPETISTNDLVPSILKVEEFQFETPKELETFIENCLTEKTDKELYDRFGLWAETINHVYVVTESIEDGFSIAQILEQETPRTLNPNILEKVFDSIKKIDKKEDLYRLATTYNFVIKNLNLLEESLNKNF